MLKIQVFHDILILKTHNRAMQNNISEFNNVIALLESAEDDNTIDRLKRRLKVYAPNFKF